jgi:hypothetical protein
MPGKATSPGGGLPTLANVWAGRGVWLSAKCPSDDHAASMLAASFVATATRLAPEAGAPHFVEVATGSATAKPGQDGH